MFLTHKSDLTKITHTLFPRKSGRSLPLEKISGAIRIPAAADWGVFVIRYGVLDDAYPRIWNDNHALNSVDALSLAAHGGITIQPTFPRKIFDGLKKIWPQCHSIC